MSEPIKVTVRRVAPLPRGAAFEPYVFDPVDFVDNYTLNIPWNPTVVCSLRQETLLTDEQIAQAMKEMSERLDRKITEAMTKGHL